jgi:hypothetical protein
MTKKIKRLLAEFEEAVRADEMKGAQDEVLRPVIEKRLELLRHKIDYHIGYLESLERKLL